MTRPPPPKLPADDLCEITQLHPEAVQQASAALPDQATLHAATQLLKTLADPTRFKLLSALHTRELCVCDLAAVAGISQSAASHQLRVLRTQRLVTYRKTGRVAYYHLLDAHIATLISNTLAHVQEPATLRDDKH